MVKKAKPDNPAEAPLDAIERRAVEIGIASIEMGVPIRDDDIHRAMQRLLDGHSLDFHDKASAERLRQLLRNSGTAPDKYENSR